MTATTTQPKTLDALLAEGRQIVAKQEQLNKTREEQQRAEKQESWEALLRQAWNDMPGLVRFLPTAMPEDFGSKPYEYSFAFRPFGAAVMTATYLIQCGENWKQSGECSRHYTFWTQRLFRPRWNEEAKAWEVAPQEYSGHSTNDLAEAVALCNLATEAYRKCEQECATKAPPAPAKFKEPEIHLSPSERDFVLAMRRLISDSIPE